MHKEQNVFYFKAYSIKELSVIYGVCDKTFKKWIRPFLKDIGEKQGRYFNINQVRAITEKLGLPSTSIID